jgi:hypothetical protein
MARKMMWTSVMCVLGVAAIASAESPEVMFQKLYGNDAAAAAKSPATKTALGFAQRLVYNANNPQIDRALVRLLLEKAYEIGCKSPQGDIQLLRQPAELAWIAVPHQRGDIVLNGGVKVRRAANVRPGGVAKYHAAPYDLETAALFAMAVTHFLAPLPA